MAIKVNYQIYFKIFSDMQAVVIPMILDTLLEKKSIQATGTCKHRKTAIFYVNKFIASKETVVLCRWRVKHKFCLIKRIDNGRITTAKYLES